MVLRGQVVSFPASPLLGRTGSGCECDLSVVSAGLWARDLAHHGPESLIAKKVCFPKVLSVLISV